MDRNEEFQTQVICVLDIWIKPDELQPRDFLKITPNDHLVSLLMGPENTTWKLVFHGHHKLTDSNKGI